MVEALAAAMPGTVAVVDGDQPRPGNGHAVISAVVEAIVTESVERMELPAAPPSAVTPTDLADTMVARMDGSAFQADRELANDDVAAARPMVACVTDTSPSAGWSCGSMSPAARACGSSRSTPGRQGQARPDRRRAACRRRAAPGAEWTAGCSGLFPALARRRIAARAGGAEPGRGVGVHDGLGPTLAAIGFDVRVPELSRRKATPSLRLFAEARPGPRSAPTSSAT